MTKFTREPGENLWDIWVTGENVDDAALVLREHMPGYSYMMASHTTECGKDNGVYLIPSVQITSVRLITNEKPTILSIIGTVNHEQKEILHIPIFYFSRNRVGLPQELAVNLVVTLNADNVDISYWHSGNNGLIRTCVTMQKIN